MSGDAARVTTDLAPRIGLRPLGDDRLARLAARGDRRALEAIYRRYHQPIYRYCRAILRDPDDAEDALQSTMYKAAAALAGETRAIALKPWLFRIAHNEAIGLLRARRPAAELSPDEAAPGVDVERSVAERDRLRQLVRDLERLPERQRGALIMRELNGLGFAEIGAAFEISPEAAKQSVYEARVSLQEIAAGRDMDCESVRQSISARDRRMLRSRRIRSHLRDCERCADFAAAIERRRTDLGALAPPLAVPAAVAGLQALLTGGAGGAASSGGTAGASLAAGSAGALGATLGGAGALKSTAAVLAAAAIAAGAADVSGVIDIGSGDREAAAPAMPGTPVGTAPAAGRAPAQGTDSSADGTSARQGAGDHGGRPDQGGGQHRDPHASGGGAPDSQVPAVSPGQSHTPPGQAQTPPGQVETPPDEIQTPPGQVQTPPGHSDADVPGGKSQATSHSNPQAAANSNSAAHTQSGLAAHGGGAATAPGQTGTAGNSANSGHSGTKPPK